MNPSYKTAYKPFINLSISFGICVVMSCGSAFAQAVGSRVEINPTGLPNTWYAGTVIKSDGSGASVLLDQREGYAPDEKYYVAKKWIRGASANAAGAPGAAGAQGAAAAQQAAGGAALSVGQRVSANYIYVAKDEFWRSGVISRIISPGVFAVHFDDGKDMVVKSDWVRPSSEAMPAANPNANAAGNTNAQAGNHNAAANQTAAAAHTTPPAPHQSEKHVAGKGAPPNGLYQCNMLSGGMYIHIGTMEINGNTYRAFNKNSGFHPFTVDGSGNMNFSAGLSGMPEGFKLTSCGYAGSDHVGRPLIKIRYVGASNAHDTIDAVRE